MTLPSLGGAEMRRRVRSALCAASFACTAAIAAPAATANAQVPQTRPVPQWGFTLGLEGVSVLFEPQFNTPFAYATRGGGMALNIGTVFKGHVLLGGEAGWAFFGGDRVFPGGVDVSLRTTNSVFGSMYTGLITSAIGRRNTIGRKLWLGVRVGSGRWSGERRFEDCQPSCAEPFRMRAGGYVSPFVVFGGGDQRGGGGFRIAYTHFLKDDAALRSTISFGLYFNLLNLD